MPLPSARIRSIRDVSVGAGSRRGAPLRAHPVQARLPRQEGCVKTGVRGRRDVGGEARGCAGDPLLCRMQRVMENERGPTADD